MQPAQQHGRRMPDSSLLKPTLIRRTRVSALTGDVTQQIHSLRASGVMSFHAAEALHEVASATLKSLGMR